MVWCFRGSKGGSGCSVVAAAAAVLNARRGPVLLVDAAGGDLSGFSGSSREAPDSPGGSATRARRPTHWRGLEVPATDGVSLLPYRGPGPGGGGDITPDSPGSPGSPESPGSPCSSGDGVRRGGAVAAAGRAAGRGRAAGGRRSRACLARVGSAFRAIGGVAGRSTLVTRLCYLALARAMEQPVPDDVIVVAEPDRALRLSDVEAALRVPVATIRWDPAVARAVDSGLLTRRLPQALHRLPPAGALRMIGAHSRDRNRQRFRTAAEPRSLGLEAPSEPAAAELVRRRDPLLSGDEAHHRPGVERSRFAGLGVVDRLLAEPDVNEIMINGPGSVWVERNRRLESLAESLTTGELDLIVEHMSPARPTSSTASIRSSTPAYRTARGRRRGAAAGG